MFQKGDILLPSTRVDKKDRLNGLFHPAIVWDDHYDGKSDFRGIMITSSKPTKIFDNILMDASHFEPGYKIGFLKSHFVNQVFIKIQKWGPFELVGRLTPEGINFIDYHLTEIDSIDYSVYEAALFK